MRAGPSSGLLPQPSVIYRGIRALLGTLAVAGLSCGSLGCGEPPDPKAPRPTLAIAVTAGEAFAGVRARWAKASTEERIALEPALVSLRARYAGDPIVRVADLYLAWIVLLRGDGHEAEAAAIRSLDPAQGNSRDLATLVRGAGIARQGRHDEAMGVLLPLVGKLLDPYARELLHEEAVEAGLASHRWTDTVEVLDAWQHEPSRETDPSFGPEAADARIERALAEIPGTALETALDRYRAAERLDDPFARKLAMRLAAIAVARGDTTLAQRLVQRQSDLAGLGKERDSLLELASTRTGPHVDGRMLGVVLGTGDDRARERAASLAFGIERGASPAPSLPITVLSLGPDAAGGLDRVALRALVQRGTVALIGGDSPRAAGDLARFAEEHEIAALLLAPPDPPLPDARWSFLSAPADDGTPALVEALRAAGATRLAIVGANLPPGDGPLRFATPCPDLALHVYGDYPFEAWQRQGVDGVILAGHEACARRALAALRRSGFRPKIGLTLDTAALARGPFSKETAPRTLVSAQIDGFPTPPTGGSPETGDPHAVLSTTGRKRADAWSVRGHGLVLALRNALARLPGDETTDETLVRERRRQAQGIFRDLGPSNVARNVVTVRVIPTDQQSPDTKPKTTQASHRGQQDAAPGGNRATVPRGIVRLRPRGAQVGSQ